MTPVERSPDAWARLRVDANCALRRGAWYRVVHLSRDRAVLDDTREQVRVARRLVETVFQAPTRWTVVPLPRDAVNVPAEWGNRYAVCPACYARAPIVDFALELRCPKCRGVFGIAWDERYLRPPLTGPRRRT
jgi:hypothetical protein